MALAPRRRPASRLRANGHECQRDVAATVAALLPGRVHQPLGEGSRRRGRALLPAPAPAPAQALARAQCPGPGPSPGPGPRTMPSAPRGRAPSPPVLIRTFIPFSLLSPGEGSPAPPVSAVAHVSRGPLAVLFCLQQGAPHEAAAEYRLLLCQLQEGSGDLWR